MRVPFLDLKRQYESLQEELESAVIEVMRSGAYIGGKYVADFEKKMSDYLGVKHVITCANGTDAIVLALRACGVGAGDEVITSPFTFFATAEAIASVGATPVFVDVKESDFNLDPEKIEERITSATKAIMPVHIFGNACDIDAIDAIAQKHNLKVIDDAAQAIGAEYKGKKIGNLCDVSTFSFYPTKNLGAFGDAGMVTTNCDELATILRALKEHGAAQNGAKAREYLHGIKDEYSDSMTASTDALYNPYKYFNYIVGYNSRLDAMQAAILSIKLDNLDKYNASRERIANMYSEGLKDVVVTPSAEAGTVSCYHQYAIRSDDKEGMGEFLASKGIGTGAFYPVPLHLQKVFDDLGYKEGSLPVAEMIATQTVCLPIFPELTDDEVAYVIDGVKAFGNR